MFELQPQFVGNIRPASVLSGVGSCGVLTFAYHEELPLFFWVIGSGLSMGHFHRAIMGGNNLIFSPEVGNRQNVTLHPEKGMYLQVASSMAKGIEQRNSIYVHRSVNSDAHKDKLFYIHDVRLTTKEMKATAMQMLSRHLPAPIFPEWYDLIWDMGIKERLITNAGVTQIYRNAAGVGSVIMKTTGEWNVLIGDALNSKTLDMRAIYDAEVANGSV